MINKPWPRNLATPTKPTPKKCSSVCIFSSWLSKTYYKSKTFKPKPRKSALVFAFSYLPHIHQKDKPS